MINLTCIETLHASLLEHKLDDVLREQTPITLTCVINEKGGTSYTIDELVTRNNNLFNERNLRLFSRLNPHFTSNVASRLEAYGDISRYQNPIVVIVLHCFTSYIH